MSLRCLRGRMASHVAQDGLTALALVGLVVAIGGCGSAADGSGSGSQETSDQKQVTLHVGYQPLYAEAWSGVVVKQLELWKKYMPSGYEVSVDWQSAIAGSVIVNSMVGEKAQIGYMGDMPSIAAMANEETPILGTATTWSEGQQCGLIAVPEDASIQGVDDLAGKTIAVPVGSCLHYFLLRLLKAEGLTDKVTVKDVTPDVIQAGFRSGGFDAGVLQEPMISKAVADGAARFLTTGAPYKVADASNLVMLADFYLAKGDWSFAPKRKGVSEFAIAWEKANLEALELMSRSPDRVVNLVHKEIPDYPVDVIRKAIYTSAPGSDGVARLRLDADWNGTPAADLLLRTGPEFLESRKAISRSVTEDMMDVGALELAAEELRGDDKRWSVLKQVGSGQSSDALAIPTR